MKITLLITVSICLTSVFTFSQTKKSTSSSSSQEVKNSTSVVSESKTTGVKRTHVPVERLSDGYLGFKNDILMKLLVKDIPQDFPKPNKGQSREDYKKTTIGWFKKNLNMVKEEYHSEFK